MFPGLTHGVYGSPTDAPPKAGVTYSPTPGRTSTVPGSPSPVIHDMWTVASTPSKALWGS